MDTDLKPGDRVRLLVHVTCADWEPLTPDFPVGSWGTVVSGLRWGSYGIVLDEDPYGLPASFEPGEIERSYG